MCINGSQSKGFRQPETKSAKTLYNMAIGMKSVFQTKLIEWAKEGGTVYVGDLKSVKRFLQKTFRSYDGSISRNCDLIRGTIVFGEFCCILPMIEKILADDDFMILKATNRFNVKSLIGGYRDVNLVLKYRSNNFICELQLNTKTFHDLKEGQAPNAGHDMYAKSRDINAT